MILKFGCTQSDFDKLKKGSLICNNTIVTGLAVIASRNIEKRPF